MNRSALATSVILLVLLPAHAQDASNKPAIKPSNTSLQPSEDVAGLPRILLIGDKQTAATLVFATTTPIPNGKLNPDRTFGDEVQYNAIATRVMAENEVAINDLHGYILPKFDELHRPGNLHSTPEGSEFLV